MKLRFQNMQTITPNHLGRLASIHLEQLRLSGTAYGHKSKSAADTLAQTFAAEEDGEGYAEFWQVASEETNKVLYDVWVFDVDTSVVFFANTAQDVGVGMIQYHFDIVGLGIALSRLTRSLQQQARQSRNHTK